MPTDKSIAEVERLKDLLGEATLIISTDFRGLNVVEMSRLRNAIRESGGRYRVAKNTLVNIAAAEIDRPEISKLMDGPTGFVLTSGDPAAPAKALLNHIQQNRLEMEVHGGYVDGQIVDESRVRFLATLPGRDELLARVLGQLNAPVASLVMVLSGTLRGLLTVLQAHIDKVGSVPAADIPAGDAPADEAAPDARADEAAEDEAEAGDAPADEAAEDAPDDAPADEAAGEVPSDEASTEESEDDKASE